VAHRRHIGAALAALCLAGCSEHDQDPAIQRVLNDAREAVLAGDGARACRLLTAHGRERALTFGEGLTGRVGKGPPRSCPEVVRALLTQAERDPESRWPDDLRDADVEVLSANGERGQAEVRVQDPVGTASRWRVQLRKTRAGWRIDDSNAVPSDD
jgi:hypothetical protein